MSYPQITEKKKKNWLRKSIIIILLLPIVFYLLSNLFFQTHLGTHLLEKKIKQRTGILLELGGLGWQPNGKIWLKEIHFLLPHEISEQKKPWLKINCLSSKVDWLELLHGRMTTDFISVDEPSIFLTKESLAALLKKYSSSLESPPMIAKHDPVKQSPSSPSMPQVTTKPSEHVPQKKLEPQPPATSPPVQINEKPAWLIIQNAALQITEESETNNYLYAKELNIKLPISGNDLQGVVECKKIQLLENSFHFSLPLEYKNHVWRWHDTREILPGWHAETLLQVSAVSALPFLLEQKISAQNAKWTGVKGFDGSVKQFLSEGKISGYCIAPQSWSGQFLCKSEGNQINGYGQSGDFDEAQAACLLRGGSVQCPNFQLLGNEFSILGNARISANGQHAAVARLVTSPEATRQAIALGNQFLLPLAFEKLETHDRYVCDVMLGGDFQKTWLTNQTGEPLLNARTLFKK